MKTFLIVLAMCSAALAQNDIKGGQGGGGGGGGGGGDVTDLISGTGVTITNPGGPSPTVAVNTAVIPTLANFQSNAPRVVTLSSSGTATFVGAMTPTLTAYTTGMIINVTANFACSSATLNIDGLSAKTLKELTGATALTCASGDFLTLFYDGTDLRRTSSTGGASTIGTTLITGPNTNSWSVPVGTTSVRVQTCGGGGGGNSSTTTDSGGGGGGGGCIERTFTATNLTSIGYVLGSGGTGGVANGGFGGTGGDSVVTLNYPTPVSFTIKGAPANAIINNGGNSGWGIYSIAGLNGAGAGGAGTASTSTLENNGSGAGGRNNTGAGFQGGTGICPGGSSGAFTSTTAQTGGASRPSLFGEAYTTGGGTGGNTTSTTPVAGGAAGLCAGGGGAGGASGVTGVAGGAGGAPFLRIFYQ